MQGRLLVGQRDAETLHLKQRIIIMATRPCPLKQTGGLEIGRYRSQRIHTKSSNTVDHEPTYGDRHRTQNQWASDVGGVRKDINRSLERIGDGRPWRRRTQGLKLSDTSLGHRRRAEVTEERRLRCSSSRSGAKGVPSRLNTSGGE